MSDPNFRSVHLFWIDTKGKIVYIEIMWPGLIKIIFYAFFAYIIYQIIRFFQAINRRSKMSSPPRSKNPSGMMVKDEVCNTYLPKEDAIKEIQEGKEYYFCSRECRRKFLERKS